MAIREFTDSRGRHWVVWAVHPTLAERRRHNAGPPVGVRERRRFVENRLHLSQRLELGWLTFEASDGERRRLSPVPGTASEWQGASEDQLRTWCALAEPAPPARRLIE